MKGTEAPDVQSYIAFGAHMGGFFATYSASSLCPSLTDHVILTIESKFWRSSVIKASRATNWTTHG
jgi:hypothetical protein